MNESGPVMCWCGQRYESLHGLAVHAGEARARDGRMGQFILYVEPDDGTQHWRDRQYAEQFGQLGRACPLHFEVPALRVVR